MVKPNRIGHGLDLKDETEGLPFLETIASCSGAIHWACTEGQDRNVATDVIPNLRCYHGIGNSKLLGLFDWFEKGDLTMPIAERNTKRWEGQ